MRDLEQVLRSALLIETPTLRRRDESLEADSVAGLIHQPPPRVHEIGRRLPFRRRGYIRHFDEPAHVPLRHVLAAVQRLAGAKRLIAWTAGQNLAADPNLGFIWQQSRHQLSQLFASDRVTRLSSMTARRILLATILCFRFDGAEELVGKGSTPIVSSGKFSFVLASSGAGNSGFRCECW